METEHPKTTLSKYKRCAWQLPHRRYLCGHASFSCYPRPVLHRFRNVDSRGHFWNYQSYPTLMLTLRGPCFLKCIFQYLDAPSCLTLCDPRDWSPPGSSDHGIFQARILEWVAMASSRGSSPLRDQTFISCVSYIGRQILHHSATGKPIVGHNL